MIPWRSFVIAAAFGLAVVCPARDETPATQAAPVSVDTCRLAADYSARFKGISMLVMLDGEIIFEDYPNKSGTRTSDTIALHFASASKCQRCVSPIDSSVVPSARRSRKKHPFPGNLHESPTTALIKNLERNDAPHRTHSTSFFPTFPGKGDSFPFPLMSVPSGKSRRKAFVLASSSRTEYFMSE